MKSRIYPFPSARHVRMVATIVSWMSKCDTNGAAEKQLLQHLGVHWDHLVNRGIAEREIYRDVMEFAAVCRGALSAERAEVLDRAVAVVTTVGRGGAPRSGPRSADHTVLHIAVARPVAKVLLKRPFRDDAYVRRHVASVIEMPVDRGERHIRANLDLIRRKLEAMDLDPAIVDLEMRDTEGRVRAELWRQVLLGGHDQ